jgi:hypothetical protein
MAVDHDHASRLQRGTRDREQLDNLLALDYPAEHILVLSDCSTDADSIVREFASRAWASPAVRGGKSAAENAAAAPPAR